MKTYIVYINGNESGQIKAGSQSAAEKKAAKKYGSSPWLASPSSIHCVYTEI